MDTSSPASLTVGSLRFSADMPSDSHARTYVAIRWGGDKYFAGGFFEPEQLRQAAEWFADLAGRLSQ